MGARSGQVLDGVRVARARQALEMTQAELAEKAEIHRVTMTNIENGNARVSLELLERLAGLLDCSRDHLLGRNEPLDEVEQARAEIGDAVQKIADGFIELADVVDDLTDQARQAAAASKVVA